MVPAQADRPRRSIRFGVLLPHWGKAATRARIVDQSRRIEQLGFDSVWVRDHLVWHPHGMEGSDTTFVEPLLSLAAISSVTERITLGTAVLIPIRWPLKLAQNLATLSFLAGPRVVAGVGLGFSASEFAAAGLRYEQRIAITRETVQICRQAWTQEVISFRGEAFQVDDVTLRPRPAESIPFWYGGGTRASVRRAIEYCDGWIPGRLPLDTLDDRLALLRRLSGESGRSLKIGNIPVMKIGRTREEARAGVNVHALGVSSEGAKNWLPPKSGSFETIEDLAGLLICGTPEECIEQIQQFVERGVDELVLDLRLQFDRFEETLQFVAERVLPAFEVRG
ncbi:MAG TPA: LLM class flavin-dependent oxidoreductase [Chloroflexota bacterium]|nr:LLM class flavin-dependent oxidoreductase [Chloroflexota bacterium]